MAKSKNFIAAVYFPFDNNFREIQDRIQEVADKLGAERGDSGAFMTGERDIDFYVKDEVDAKVFCKEVRKLKIKGLRTEIGTWEHFYGDDD